MNEFWQVPASACLPALGNLSGGLLAEFVETTPHALNKALHAASGILIAVVAVEIMPEAIGVVPPWAMALAFVLGGGEETAGMWIIYIAVSVDLFGDGLLIGTGSAVDVGLVLVLALSQVMADIPEEFASLANFRAKRVPRGKRLMLAACLAPPVLLAGAFGYWILRDQSDALKLSALAFTAGLLTVAAVEEMIGEAHESARDTRASILFFAGGFALFTLVSGCFEPG